MLQDHFYKTETRGNSRACVGPCRQFSDGGVDVTVFDGHDVGRRVGRVVVGRPDGAVAGRQREVEHGQQDALSRVGADVPRTARRAELVTAGNPARQVRVVDGGPRRHETVRQTGVIAAVGFSVAALHCSRTHSEQVIVARDRIAAVAERHQVAVAEWLARPTEPGSNHTEDGCVYHEATAIHTLGHGLRQCLPSTLRTTVK